MEINQPSGYDKLFQEEDIAKVKELNINVEDNQDVANCLLTLAIEHLIENKLTIAVEYLNLCHKYSDKIEDLDNSMWLTVVYSYYLKCMFINREIDISGFGEKFLYSEYLDGFEIGPGGPGATPEVAKELPVLKYKKRLTTINDKLINIVGQNGINLKAELLDIVNSARAMFETRTKTKLTVQDLSKFLNNYAYRLRRIGKFYENDLDIIVPRNKQLIIIELTPIPLGPLEHDICFKLASKLESDRNKLLENDLEDMETAFLLGLCKTFPDLTDCASKPTKTKDANDRYTRGNIYNAISDLNNVKFSKFSKNLILASRINGYRLNNNPVAVKTVQNLPE
ncbi:MAG: hypothetical protein LHV68_12960 [Elusimicrobia bacterium]|nr:hypothetical protein [Candidatus Liberimonas magnetica]